MFKSIQFKIVLLFSTLVVALVTVLSTFLAVNILNFYNDEFSVMMEQVFTDELVFEMSKTAETASGLDGVSKVIASHVGPLGIDTYRFYAIIDAKNAKVLVSSDPQKTDNLEITDNIITAMAGSRGDVVSADNSYMDYAVPITKNGEPIYIAYIKDTKDEVNNITRNVTLIILRALLLTLVIAIILGYLFGKTITVPIASLTKRAEQLAAGDFKSISPSSSSDEIGRLHNTFRYMSSALSETIEQVKSEKTKLETILQNMTDGILAFNLSGELILINPEAKRIIGREFTDDISFNSFFSELGANITIGDLLYISHDAPLERRITISDKYIKLNFATNYRENKADSVVVVLYDITKQEKLELSRREFVANVSHELRTPLATVKSYAETLMDTAFNDPDVERRFLSVIVKEADRMTRIVKDLLVLSRLDEGVTEEKRLEKIELKPFIEGIVERLSVSAHAKAQEISYTSMNEVPYFMGNRDKLEQVVINIVSNAVKYTPNNGRIEVFTGRLYNDAYIKVCDNGIGIPKENLPRIFERFYRVDKARSRDTGGTGLGLAIAKKIMDSMGGSINITSDYGKGTEVVISIPLKGQ